MERYLFVIYFIFVLLNYNYIVIIVLIICVDEPAFGCFLDHVVGVDRPRIPAFVQQCIAAIESTEENLKTDGLYRASGNLSQVQKIRLQVDQNNLSVIDREEDVHVLTGALKLFFRELREPLIPYHAFSKAISAGIEYYCYSYYYYNNS